MCYFFVSRFLIKILYQHWNFGRGCPRRATLIFKTQRIWSWNVIFTSKFSISAQLVSYSRSTNTGRDSWCQLWTTTICLWHWWNEEGILFYSIFTLTFGPNFLHEDSSPYHTKSHTAFFFNSESCIMWDYLSKKGVFWFFTKTAVTIFLMFLIIVENNRAHHWARLLFLENSLGGIH